MRRVGFRRPGVRRHVPMKIVIIKNAKTGREERYQYYEDGKKELIPNNEPLPKDIPVVHE